MPTDNNPFEQIIIPTQIPSAWPPAPIYWAILFGVICIVILLVWIIKRRIKKQQTINSALKKLAQLQQSNTTNFVQLNELLKGICLHYYPRQEVASLAGQAWFLFLQQHHAKKSMPIFNDSHEFCERLYQGNSTCTAEDFKAAKQWIKGFPTQVITLKKLTNNREHHLTGKQHV
jgi:uncharacterized membrane-anchored protein YhcB (DUF1043 family)